MTEIPEHLRRRAQDALRRIQAASASTSEWPDAVFDTSPHVPVEPSDSRPDLTFRTTVPIPEVWGSYLQAIRGIASVERMLDDKIEIVIEAKDEYELAGYIHELEQELGSISGDTVDIPRPTRVEKLDG